MRRHCIPLLFFGNLGELYVLDFPSNLWKNPLSSGEGRTHWLNPFGRVWDELRQPNQINYPIPAVGARNRPQWVSEINEPFCPA